ncbi:14312_t:CDS:2, partial [Funneliformis mosseae]
MSTGKETTNIDPGQENDKNASLSSDFHLDANMHYIEAIGKWTYTSEDGETLQFDEDQQQWIKIEEDLLLKLQQSAYSVPGVNEIYVTGLPPDVTVNELAEVFSKYGVLMEDLIA